MIWPTRYLAPVQALWKGRENTPPHACFFQIIRLLDLNKPLPVIPKQQSVFGLIGFPSDEGVRRNQGRTGAAHGPAAIRQILAKMSIKNPDLICYDAGDISCTDSHLEEAQRVLSQALALLLQQGITPIVLGGGHDLAYGHYLGIAKVIGSKPLGILNFDAHFDMRAMQADKKGNSGTPFLQIAEAHKARDLRFDYNCIGIQPASNTQPLYNTAKHWQVKFLEAEDIHSGDTEKTKAFLDRIIQENQVLYVSLCLDVFAAAYAPGVSASQAFGLTPWQVLPLLRHLAASGKVISYDIAELSPKYDVDYRTAKLAASFIYEIVHTHHGNPYHAN